jgi:hypothetical protein
MWSCVEDDQIPLASGIDVAFAMAQQAGNLGLALADVIDQVDR